MGTKVYRLADYQGNVVRDVPVDAKIARREDGFYDIVGSGEVDVLTINDRPTKKTKKPLSTQAAAAKAIRGELKAAFPGVTFKVTSDSFSGGDSVDIRWTDGPTTAQVDAISRKYQYGHFDGMIDLYEYSNTRDDIPQSKYVQTQRDYTHDARRAALAYVNRRWGWDLRYIERESPAFRNMPAHRWLEIDPESDGHTGHGWKSSEVNAELYKTSLLCPTCHAATLPGDAYCPQCGNALATTN